MGGAGDVTDRPGAAQLIQCGQGFFLGHAEIRPVQKIDINDVRLQLFQAALARFDNMMVGVALVIGPGTGSIEAF